MAVVAGATWSMGLATAQTPMAPMSSQTHTVALLVLPTLTMEQVLTLHTCCVGFSWS